MKSPTRILGGSILPIAALVLSAAHAYAIDLIYEPGSTITPVGTVFSSGQINIKAIGFNESTVYSNLAVGTSVGFGDGGAAANTLGGVSALDALAQSVPTNTRLNGLFNGAGQGLREDSWGVFRVTTINDVLGDPLYTQAVKGKELTAIFYGVQDSYIRQTATDTQVISSVGLRIDFYEDAGLNFDPTGGPGVRLPGAAAYPTVTDGTPILSLESVSGFLHPDGTLGGTAAELESVFNTSSLSGTASTFMRVIGGRAAEVAQFDSDGFTSPFLPGQTADMKFLITINPGFFGWELLINDPIIANISSVPEPGTAFAGIVCGLGVMMRRRRK